MCGIAGILNNRSFKTDPVDLMTRMIDSIGHRGPDESGIYLDNSIVLGHVRLSIIDLASGQQPMISADGDFVIVLNGEIFNYPELREDLVNRGYRFRTSSDTEVLLTMYREYGKDCLHRLTGQFAFAIWDTKKEELFLARDRVGIRPLFYTSRNGSFIFASEMKALFQVPGISATPDYRSLKQIFTFWSAIAPATPFDGVKELPPGSFIKVTHKGITNPEKWWTLQFPDPQNYFRGSLEEAIEEFERLFLDATRLRLRADVPVAAYLSGGLDSSATTWYIQKTGQKALQTFSIGFSDREFDESGFQNQVSSFLKTNHTAFNCDSSDIFDIFPDVVWHSETPLLRTSPAPMFLLAEKVRSQDIKVVITGEGADEMLGGYDIFKEMIIRKFWARQPGSKIRPMLLGKLYPYIPQIANMNALMLKFAFGYKLSDTDNPLYSHLLRWNNTSLAGKYLSDSIASATSDYNPVDDLPAMLPDDFAKWDDLPRAQWLEINYFMSSYLLSSQGDRMAMANAIEGRYPFLDYRIIEFCASLPPKMKTNGLTEKYLLKKHMYSKLPEEVVARQKQAYRAPIHTSFIPRLNTGYADRLLSSEKINEYNIFDATNSARFISELRTRGTGSEIEAMALAGILSGQLFFDQFIAGNRPNKRSILSPPEITNRKSI